MRLRWRWLGALVVTSALAGFQATIAAEDPETASPGRISPVDVPSANPPATPAELEAAIRGLSEPVDQEEVGKIFFDLGRLENPAEQQRLQQLLDERTRALMRFPPPSEQPANGTSQHSPGPGPAVTEEELQMRLEMLNLGPQATADDLRVRDELVSAIAGVADPVRREQLLHRLEEREREAETAVSTPVESGE